jgi:hypothetical protein
LKSLHKISAAPQIANLMLDPRKASTSATIRAAGAPPLSLPGQARAAFDPPGGIAAQVSLPLCERPSLFLKAKAVAA